MGRIGIRQYTLLAASVILMIAAMFIVVQKTMFTQAAPGINKTINFQGKMTDSQGLNVPDGTYQFVFRIYSVASGGSAAWTETVNLSVADGIFHHNLGSSTALPGSVDFNTDNIFLGITFNSDPDGEMSPRIQLTASPYAFNADKLNGLDASDLVQLSPSVAQTGDIDITGSVSAGSANISGNLTVGTDSLFVNASNDRVGIGTTDTSQSVFRVSGTAPNVNGGSTAFIDASLAGTTGNRHGLNSIAWVTGTTGTYNAINGDAGSSTATETLQGVNGTAGYGGTGTIATINALAGQSGNWGSGTVSSASGLLVYSAYNVGGGAVTNNYGIYVHDQSAGANNYGLYINGASTAAIHVNSGSTYLGGNLTTTGTVTLGSLANCSTIQSDGSGALSCGYSNGITGSGTSGQVSYFNGSGTITSSANLLFNGTTLTTNALAVTNNTTVGGSLSVGDDSSLALRSLLSSNYTDPYGFNFHASPRVFSLTSEQGSLQQALIFGDTNSSTHSMFAIGASSDSGSTWNPHFIVRQNGNIGIGTASPAERLQVNGNIGLNGLAALRTSSTTGLLIQNSAMTAGAAGGGLHLAGGGYLNSSSRGGVWVGATSDLGTYTARDNVASGVQFHSGNIYLRANTGLTVGNTFSPTNRIVVNGSTGNVDISSGSLQTGATTRLTNTGVLQNVTHADASAFFTGGSIPVNRGGTGATTAQGAINAISGLTTQGDLLYHNGTNSTRLARGTDGQCLTSTSTTISWGDCGAGGGGDILQGGNAFSETFAIGTTDQEDVQIVTDGETRVTIGTDGNTSFTGSVEAPRFSGGEVDVAPLSNGQDKYIWSSVTGWINLEPGTLYDLRVYEDHLEGVAWGAAVGWINFGTYTGGDSHIYANTDDTDYGVNRDPVTGELSGQAWNEATGWVNFNPNSGGVTHDPVTGEFTGYAWSENFGWISFSGVADDSTPYAPRAALGSRSVKAGTVEASAGIKIGASSTDYGYINYNESEKQLILGSTTGGVTIQNGADTASAFKIQATNGDTLLAADTLTRRLHVGASTPLASSSQAGAALEIAALQTSQPSPTWTSRPATAANSWSSITYGNGLFVAVAQSGTNRVMTSPDGITWTPRTAAEANSWTSITYGNGLFVAVSGDGTNQVMTSPDGITWTPRTAAEANWWQSVTYGNGLFVAVAYNGTNRVMTSPDGITWTPRTAAENNQWNSVTYGNGLFVAVANSGTNRVMTSPDGVTWTARSAPSDNWVSVTYGIGIFVAVATSSDQVMISSDGVNWTDYSALPADYWGSVTYGNGLFVAVGTWVDGDTVAISPDGITWTARTAAEANQWNSVTYGNGLFVAVSFDGANRVMTMQHGWGTGLRVTGNTEMQGTLNVTANRRELFTWTPRPVAGDNTWYSVTYGNGLFVAVVISGTNRVMTSPDGITWTPRSVSSTASWLSVTYGNGLFVAVAISGTNRVMTSPDGITWTLRPAAENNYWTSVTYGNGLFVAVARDGTNRVMTSPDGITWTPRTAAENNQWLSVTYGNGLFVAVAMSGTNRVMTSPDGITWTPRTAVESNWWNSVTYGNGLFVAVAGYGINRVMTSPDGITWTPHYVTQGSNWTSVTYGNGLFVAVAESGTNRVMTSPDGITWTPRSAAEANEWQSVTYGNGLFVAVAQSGTNRVMTSPGGYTTALKVTGNTELTGAITINDGLLHVRGNGSSQAAQFEGLVGIQGNLNVQGNLSIQAQSDTDYISRIYNTSTAATNKGLLISLGNRTSTSGRFIGFSNADGVVSGYVRAGSSVAYTTNGADFAEYFRADPDDLPQPGELVGLDPQLAQGVKRTSAAADRSLMGVISTNPGFIGNGPICQVDDDDCEANYERYNVLVALTGQVPVKVTAANGAIQPGDYLTSSDLPGTAMKATGAGRVIGRALDSHTAGEGTIMVVIGVEYYNPSDGQHLQADGFMVSSYVQQGQAASFSSLNVSGLATLASLTVSGDAMVAGRLVVAGDISVSGRIISRGAAPTVEVLAAAQLTGVSISGTDVAGTITFTVPHVQAGALGKGEVLGVSFTSTYTAAPRVILSPVNDAAAKLAAFATKAPAGFTLHIAEVADGGVEYSFDYIVVGAEN